MHLITNTNHFGITNTFKRIIKPENHNICLKTKENRLDSPFTSKSLQ